jgi:hypothetical protein
MRSYQASLSVVLFPIQLQPSILALDNARHLNL